MWLIVEGTGSGGVGGQMVVVGLRVQVGRVMSAGAHLVPLNLVQSFQTCPEVCI